LGFLNLILSIGKTSAEVESGCLYLLVAQGSARQYRKPFGLRIQLKKTFSVSDKACLMPCFAFQKRDA
jgi:hypothetical protein